MELDFESETAAVPSHKYYIRHMNSKQAVAVVPGVEVVAAAQAAAEVWVDLSVGVG